MTSNGRLPRQSTVKLKREPEAKRRAHEKWFSMQTGIAFDHVEWIPQGIACPTCNGDGRIERGYCPDSRDPTYVETRRHDCPDCLSGDWKGALDCDVGCGRPATLRLTTPDGETFKLCEQQRCFDSVRSLVVPGSGASVVDTQAAR